MSMLAEYDARRRQAHARDLLRGLWAYMTAFEEADPRVVEIAAPDLLELHGRIDRLVKRNSKDKAA